MERSIGASAHLIACMRFRPLTVSDLPALHDWLRRPHIRQWWGEVGSATDVAHEYRYLTQEDSSTRGFVACCDGEAIGFIKCCVVMGSGDGWWEAENDPDARGIDQFLLDANQLGKGLGSAMVAAFVDHLFGDPSVTKVQTDPAPYNARAIHAYRKAGFADVGEVITPDGPALLMVKRRPA